MRRTVLIIITTAVLVAACSSSSSHGARQAPSMPTTRPVVRPATTSTPGSHDLHKNRILASQLDLKYYCSARDNFCAEFPVVPDADPYGDRDDRFRSVWVHGYGHPPFDAYVSFGSWGLLNGQRVFCKDATDKLCDSPGSVTEWFVRVWSGRAAASLNEGDDDCYGTPDRHETSTGVDGVLGQLVSCVIRADGVPAFHFVHVHHAGLIYEFGVEDDAASPQLVDRFIRSFAFTN